MWSIDHWFAMQVLEPWVDEWFWVITQNVGYNQIVNPLL